MTEKSDSTKLALATVAVIGQPPRRLKLAAQMGPAVCVNGI